MEVIGYENADDVKHRSDYKQGFGLKPEFVQKQINQSCRNYQRGNIPQLDIRAIKKELANKEQNRRPERLARIVKRYELLGDIYNGIYQIKLDKPLEIGKSIVFVGDFIAYKKARCQKEKGNGNSAKAVVDKH